MYGMCTEKDQRSLIKLSKIMILPTSAAEGGTGKAGHGTASWREEAETDTRSSIALRGWQFNRLLVGQPWVGPSFGPRIGPTLSQSVKFERLEVQTDQRAILRAQYNELIPVLARDLQHLLNCHPGSL